MLETDEPKPTSPVIHYIIIESPTVCEQTPCDSLFLVYCIGLLLGYLIARYVYQLDY